MLERFDRVYVNDAPVARLVFDWDAVDAAGVVTARRADLVGGDVGKQLSFVRTCHLRKNLFALVPVFHDDQTLRGVGWDADGGVWVAFVSLVHGDHVALAVHNGKRCSMKGR